MAFFDFDGTITNRDSLLEFIKFRKGRPAMYAGFLINTHWLIAHRLKMISGARLKEKMLTYFFSGEPEAVFQEQSNLFADQILPAFIRAGAVTEINRLREQGFEMMVVSASPQNWISRWAKKNAMGAIATRLEVKDGWMTGKIQGKNCQGPEKVNRIRENLDLSVYEIIYAYGDTPDDKPMMALAGRSFYKPFRKT